MNVYVYLDAETETYSIEVNGKTLFECLAEDEVDNMTLKELSKEFSKVL